MIAPEPTVLRITLWHILHLKTIAKLLFKEVEPNAGLVCCFVRFFTAPLILVDVNNNPCLDNLAGVNQSCFQVLYRKQLVMVANNKIY